MMCTLGLLAPFGWTILESTFELSAFLSLLLGGLAILGVVAYLLGAFWFLLLGGHFPFLLLGVLSEPLADLGPEISRAEGNLLWLLAAADIALFSLCMQIWMAVP